MGGVASAPGESGRTAKGSAAQRGRTSRAASAAIISASATVSAPSASLKALCRPSRVTVTGSDTALALARLGYGLVQAPRYGMAADFAAGTLAEVLPDYPPSAIPVSALYPQSRPLSPRVRVFVDWLVQIFRPYRG